MEETFLSVEWTSEIPTWDWLDWLGILSIAQLWWNWYDSKTIDSQKERDALYDLLNDPIKYKRLEETVSNKKNGIDFIKMLWGSYVDRLCKIWKRSFSERIHSQSKIWFGVTLSLKDKIDLMKEIQSLNYSLFQSEFIEKGSQEEIVDEFGRSDPYFKYAKHRMLIKQREWAKTNWKMEKYWLTEDDVDKKIAIQSENNEKIKLQVLIEKSYRYAEYEKTITQETSVINTQLVWLEKQMQNRVKDHYMMYLDQYKSLLKHTTWANFLTKWIANSQSGVSTYVFPYLQIAKIFNLMGSLDYTSLWEEISTEIICAQIDLMDAYKKTEEEKMIIFSKKTIVASKFYNYLRKGVESWVIEKSILEQYVLFDLLPSWVVKEETKDDYFPGLTTLRTGIKYTWDWSTFEINDDLWENEKYTKYIEYLIANDDSEMLTQEVNKMSELNDVVDQIQAWKTSEEYTPANFVPLSDLSISSLNITPDEKQLMNQWYIWCSVRFPGWWFKNLLVTEYEYTKFTYSTFTKKYVFLPKWRVLEHGSTCILKDDDDGYLLRDTNDEYTVRTIPNSTIHIVNASRNAVWAIVRNDENLSSLHNTLWLVQMKLTPFALSLQWVQKWMDFTYSLQNNIIPQALELRNSIEDIRNSLSESIACAEKFLSYNETFWGDIISDEDKKLQESILWYKRLLKSLEPKWEFDTVLDKILDKENTDPATLKKFLITQWIPMLWALIAAVLVMIATWGRGLIPMIAASTAAWIVWWRVTQYVTTKIANGLDNGPVDYDNPTLEQLLARWDISTKQYLAATWKEYVIWAVTSGAIIGLWRGISSAVGKFAKKPWTMWNIARALQNKDAFLNPFKHRKVDVSKPSNIWKDAWKLQEKISLASVQTMQEAWEEFAEAFPEILVSLYGTSEIDRDDEKQKKKAGLTREKCLGYVIAVWFCLHPTSVRHTFWKKYDLQMSQNNIFNQDGTLLETWFSVNDQNFNEFVEDADRIYSQMWYTMTREGETVIFSTDDTSNPPHKMTFTKSKESVDVTAAKQKIPWFDDLWVDFQERRIVDDVMTYMYTYREDVINQETYNSQKWEDFSLKLYMEWQWYYTFEENGVLEARKSWWPHIIFTKEEKNISEDASQEFSRG